MFKIPHFTRQISRRCLGVFLLLCLPAGAIAAEPPAPRESKETAAQRGYRWLTTKAFLPPDFSQAVFDELWTTWPEPLKKKAEEAAPAERRAMTFARYGFVEAPERKGQGPALGYVDDGQGNWVMNCLACHGGKINGQSVPGLPNSHYMLANLTADVLAVKLRLSLPLGHMEVGSLGMPLGGSQGTTNAVAFGVALESFRDKDMNVHREYPLQPLVHHDLDAPPFWNVKKKSHLYYDGGVKKGARSLLQFILIPRYDAATVKSWEADYTDILAWIESLEPPKYPWPIDRELAHRGEALFVKNCSECHGTYGPDGKYPNRVVALSEIGTDPVRHSALSHEHRRRYGESWLGYYNVQNVRVDSPGYIAPPLDGIWASAPYLHNGSVPTLWHLFHPEQRPAVWLRSENGYDREKLGLEVSTFDRLPRGLTDDTERRRYFNTRLTSKSAAGHTYPDRLTPAEKLAVLEYLKTL